MIFLLLHLDDQLLLLSSCIIVYNLQTQILLS